MSRAHNARISLVLMSFASTHPIAIGNFRITPLSRSHDAGHHTALLSIRRGAGRQAYDRIYTFKPEFATRDSALLYAAAQGRHWLSNPASLA